MDLGFSTASKHLAISARASRDLQNNVFLRHRTPQMGVKMGGVGPSSKHYRMSKDATAQIEECL